MKFGVFDLLIISLGLAFCADNPVAGESLTCLTVYKEGGAPAVFQSPRCPRWTLSNFKSQTDRQSGACQSAMLQGRRKSQEDRIHCALDLRIPFPGPQGVKEVKVGIMAVFDGHNGSEASEMASELLLEYFVLHTYFLLDSTYSILSRKLIRRLPNKGEDGPGFQKIDWNDDLDRLDFGRFKATMSAILDGSFPFELLREALLRAIRDIDAAFSKDATTFNLNSGTTATVVLLADTQILVANVGDSKAILCSEVYQSPSEAKATVLRIIRERRSSGISSSIKEYRHLKSMASNGWTVLIAKELTNDHHPDRDDEKSRVESAGGNISKWAGVSRVNGQLAVSRAIGDIHFKSFGVISVPEVTDWQPLTANDSYVIAASDGVFEKLSPQDICDMLWEPLVHFTRPPNLNSSCNSLADCIVNTAFERGSTDNLAAVMIPVKASGAFETFVKDRGYTARKVDYSAVEGQRQINENSADGNTPVLMELQPHPDVAKFDRLLVEGKHNFGCFYLSENLDVNDDYTFWVHKDDQEFVSHQSPALTGTDQFLWSGQLDLYNDQHICVHFGMHIDEDKDQCMNSDAFARFLGLLESIPFHNTGQNEHVTSDTRYILKKKFDRGAFGEVWLAFDWNCSQVGKDPKSRHVQKNILYRNELLRAYGENTAGNVFGEDCNAGSDGNMFILKRIMVERGISAYLSGLREKYFGEVFLNASNSLQGSSSPAEPDFVSKISQCNVYGFTNVNESVNQESEEEPLNLEDVVFREKRLHGAAYEEGLNHIARYVESFESRSNEIWLVFRHEGVSLSKLLYTAEEVGTDADKERNEHGKRVQILRPSRWWHWLRTTEAGQEEFRNIIWQLLMALKSCHDRNITHRDIKPENMVICFEDKETGGCLRGSPDSDKNYTTKMRIIDFGSAVNDFTVKHLYGSVGPSSAEQTSEYAPPEAFLNVSWYRGPSSVTAKYDMWSVGVVILEFILGSPNVFQINSVTQALLNQHLKGWNDSLKELAYKLRALMEMCILIPGISSKLRQNWGTNGQGSSSPVSWKCSEEYFSYQIQNRDPLKLGFPNVWALRLVRDLLRWDPEDRLGVDDALKHPYFSSASWKSTRGKLGFRLPLVARSWIPIEDINSNGPAGIENTNIARAILFAFRAPTRKEKPQSDPGMANRRLGEATENRDGNDRSCHWIHLKVSSILPRPGVFEVNIFQFVQCLRAS
ncbi:putative inactive protein kinase [Sesamum alatum]|uniref:Inactive protein kinase n=1 Tax=Sesamum alatum TaxID=300844 RepID=A0AAE1XUL1_9LAMI|nr:putative inactive protein kinase [Sesamum alatum]